LQTWGDESLWLGFAGTDREFFQRWRQSGSGSAPPGRHWYLFVFDVKRDAMRTFTLPRLQSPEITAERFTIPKNVRFWGFHSPQRFSGVSARHIYDE